MLTTSDPKTGKWQEPPNHQRTPPPPGQHSVPYRHIGQAQWCIAKLRPQLIFGPKFCPRFSDIPASCPNNLKPCNRSSRQCPNVCPHTPNFRSAPTHNITMNLQWNAAFTIKVHHVFQKHCKNCCRSCVSQWVAADKAPKHHFNRATKLHWLVGYIFTGVWEGFFGCISKGKMRSNYGRALLFPETCPSNWRVRFLQEWIEK